MILSFRTDRPGQTVVFGQIGLDNSVDPDQTAPTGAVCSGSTLFATHYSMVEPYCSNCRMITAIFQLSEYLGVLQYMSRSMTKSTN